MSDEEKKDLENKISELKKELELWEKYRELKKKIGELKKDSPTTIITYPVYPTYPEYPTYPIYPWYLRYNGATSGDRMIYCTENENG